MFPHQIVVGGIPVRDPAMALVICIEAQADQYGSLKTIAAMPLKDAPLGDLAGQRSLLGLTCKSHLEIIFNLPGVAIMRQ